MKTILFASLLMLSACATPSLFDVNHHDARIVDPDGGPAPLSEVGKARQAEAYAEAQRMEQRNAANRQQAWKDSQSYKPVIGSQPIQAYQMPVRQQVDCTSTRLGDTVNTSCR